MPAFILMLPWLLAAPAGRVLCPSSAGVLLSHLLCPPVPPATHCLTSLLPGVKIIFRVGLVLLKHTLGSSDKLKSCQGQYETMERLRALSPKIMQETFLVQEVRCRGARCHTGAGCPWVGRARVPHIPGLRGSSAPGGGTVTEGKTLAAQLSPRR